MNSRIDPHVRAIFDEIVAAAPDPGPSPSAELQQTDGHRRPPWLTVAAITILVLGAAAIVGATWLRADSADDASTAQLPLPLDVPALLEPAADSRIEVLRRNRFVPEQPTPGGAVLAPDGTVFGIALVPTAPIDLAILPDSYDERTIAGHPGWAMQDGSAPEQIYRGLEVECATLTVTTAGEPMWSSDVELLANSIESDGTTLTVGVPDGWTSLGATTISESYDSTLAVRIDSTDYQVRLTQAIGAPVGPLLATMESNPIQIIHGTGELWHVAGATTPGYNTLIGRQHNTAFSLTGDAPVDILTQLVDGLTAVPASDWLQRPTTPEPTIDTDMAVETVSLPPSCALHQLELVRAP